MGGKLLEKEVLKSIEIHHPNFVHILGAETLNNVNLIAMEEAHESLSDTIHRVSP